MTLSALALLTALALPQLAPGDQAAAPEKVRPRSEGSAPGAVACPAGEGTGLEAPLGIVVCQGTVRVAVRMTNDPQPGARVATVVASGPAARAGLAANDVIYLVNGTRVENGADALARLKKVPENSVRLQINFWRDGLPFIVRIPLEAR